MEYVFVVKMKRLGKPRTKDTYGEIGYHSAWAHKIDAKIQAKLRNKLHGDEYHYYVSKELPLHIAKNYRNETLAKFDKSVGYLTVYEYP